MKLLKLKNSKSKNRTMTTLVLESSLCKDCGACCFDCEYLGKDGCSNQEFRKNSRCISFPILFGNAKRMGLSTLLDYQEKDTEKQEWFIFFYSKCKILSDSRLLNCLRHALRLINSKKHSFIFFSFMDKTLLIYVFS